MQRNSQDKQGTPEITPHIMYGSGVGGGGLLTASRIYHVKFMRAKVYNYFHKGFQYL